MAVVVEEMIEDKIDNAKVKSVFDPLDFKALKEVQLYTILYYHTSSEDDDKTESSLQSFCFEMNPECSLYDIKSAHNIK